MKHFFSILFFLCFVTFSFAQLNTIKVGIGSAFQKDLHLKYERAFAENHSFQIGVLADFTESIDNEGLANLPLGFGFEIDELFTSKYGGFAIVPEYRYYFSKAGSPRGFYLGAFAKYRQRNFSIDSNFGTDIGIDASATLWNIGAGLGMGAQFIISDKFVIDWYIGGLGYNRFFASAKIAPSNDGDFEQLQMDLIQEIDDFSYESLGVEEETLSMADFDTAKSQIRDAVENTEIREFNTGNIGFGLIDIRTGISLGYAF